MDFISPNLKLPYLAPAQAQKHVTHNEALRQLDTIVQLSVLRVASRAVADPKNGNCYIVSSNPEDSFIGKANYIAAFQDGAWAFLAPNIGWRCYIQDVAEFCVFDGTEWQALRNESVETVQKFGINTTADDVNRLSVKSPATLLDNESGGHQLKINKASNSDMASLVFQSGYTGHAELVLAGDQDFHIKTSADGSEFRESLTFNRQTGAVKTPLGLNPNMMSPPTNNCGGPDSFYGLPSASSIVVGRRSLTLVANRVIFTAVYLDREAVLQGGRVAQYIASSDAGAIMRCGLYHLGMADGNSWNLGDLIYDFGYVAADVAGHKIFDMETAITLSQGWYVFAVGVNGAGSAVRYVQSRQPGLGYIQPHGSGTGADIRFGGPTSYMKELGLGDEITNGFSQNLPSNPDIVPSSNGYGYNIFIPKWAVFN